jgi:hypothetical protein
MKRAISDRARSVALGQRLDGRLDGSLLDSARIRNHDAAKRASRCHPLFAVQVRDELLGLGASIRCIEHRIDAGSNPGIRLVNWA